MNNVKALELIKSGKVDALQQLLEDEIYQATLKLKPGAKQRYAAMKKYFKYHTSVRACLTKPCSIKFEDKDYICFTNSWSLALTTEPCGEIELYDESFGKYPDVTRLIRWDGIKKKIDFNKVIAEAKSKGYKLTKSEVEYGFKYLMLYDGTYYKIGLIDATYGIINDGEIAMTYHPYGERTPLTIHNKLGICIIMPVKYDDGIDPEDDGKIVIRVGDDE
jgi:hypothetical protein